MKAIVYIDGFNLYHGSVKGTSYKWLDLQAYFELLRNGDEIVAVKYFTAPMHGSPANRQRTYLRALETCPKVNVILGKYKTKQAQCKVTDCCHSGDRRFTTWEEKRTDVNIAIHILDDAYQNQCELIVVVSGDSDLVPALNMVKLRFPEKRIVVYIPARNESRGAATEIRSAADKDATLPQNLLKRAQFPRDIDDGAGGVITKPESW
jgi:6-hydroxy-3-succinoylpyridine 3-monooxygenase